MREWWKTCSSFELDAFGIGVRGMGGTGSVGKAISLSDLDKLVKVKLMIPKAQRRFVI